MRQGVGNTPGANLLRLRSSSVIDVHQFSHLALPKKIFTPAVSVNHSGKRSNASEGARPHAGPKTARRGCGYSLPRAGLRGFPRTWRRRTGRTGWTVPENPSGARGRLVSAPPCGFQLRPDMEIRFARVRPRSSISWVGMSRRSRQLPFPLVPGVLMRSLRANRSVTMSTA